MTPHAASAVLFFLAGVGVTLTFAAHMSEESHPTVMLLAEMSLTVFVGAIVLAVVR
jgi:hypothetical protein